MTWRVGDQVRYARHKPDEPNVQRFNDDGDIGRAGIVTQIDDGRCYGHVAYLVRWDDPHPDGSIGVWCAAEQLEANR